MLKIVFLVQWIIGFVIILTSFKDADIADEIAEGFYESSGSVAVSNFVLAMIGMAAAMIVVPAIIILNISAYFNREEP